MKESTDILLAVVIFLLGFLSGFVLHIVLTNRRLTRRGMRPRDILGI